MFLACPFSKVGSSLSDKNIQIFLAAGDQTIIVSSYGRIGSDLDELDKTAWLATAYLCTTTAFQPLYGKLGDIFGRKACLLFSYSVFGLGALFCGLSGNMTQLIVARVRFPSIKY